MVSPRASATVPRANAPITASAIQPICLTREVMGCPRLCHGERGWPRCAPQGRDRTQPPFWRQPLGFCARYPFPGHGADTEVKTMATRNDTDAGRPRLLERLMTLELDADETCRV